MENHTNQSCNEILEQSLQTKLIINSTGEDSTNTDTSCETNNSKETEDEYYSQFPVTVTTNTTLGRYLVAKRDIKAGEILLRDSPIFMSPNGGDDDTCLGCCLKAKNPTPCSNCGWTVCGADCEKIPSHANNECAVFSQAGLKPPLPTPHSFVDSAELIKVLRAILISQGRNEVDRTNWDVMLKLESHLEQRATIPKVRFMSTLTKNFIRDACQLKDIPEERIDLILGIIDVNAFRHTIHPNNPMRAEAVKENKDIDRNATFLYPRGSMAAHGCRRNVRWETLPSGTLEMWAAEDVPAGSLLTHPYVDLMQGTPDRRKQLNEQFYFDCSCERCSDQTELGTNFSTLKCPECSPGNLLAENPLNYESLWICDSCGISKSSTFERELVRKIQSETKEVLGMLQFSGNLAVIGGLARILGKHRGRTVHSNHFSMIDVEYHLVKRMALMTKPTVDLLQEMKKLIHKFLDIAVVFYPGIK